MVVIINPSTLWYIAGQTRTATSSLNKSLQTTYNGVSFTGNTQLTVTYSLNNYPLPNEVRIGIWIPVGHGNNLSTQLPNYTITPVSSTRTFLGS
jgi:hypothetical protein